MGIGLPIALVPLTMVAILTACHLWPRGTDRLFSVTNINDIIHDVAFVGAGGTTLLCLTLLWHPYIITPRRVLATIGPGAVVAGLVLVEWLLAPVHTLATPEDLNQWERAAGSAGAVAWIHQTYIIVVYVVAALMLIYQAMDTSLIWRMALLMAAAGVAMAGIGQIATIRGFLSYSDEQLSHLQATTQIIDFTGLAIYSIGILLPVPAALTAAWLIPRRNARMTTPLWTFLTQQFPHLALPLSEKERPEVVEERRYAEITASLRRLSIPRQAAAALLQSDDPAGELGRFLASGVLRRATPQDAVPASTALPPQATVEGERIQLLRLAKSYRRVLGETNKTAAVKMATVVIN